MQKQVTNKAAKKKTHNTAADPSAPHTQTTSSLPSLPHVQTDLPIPLNLQSINSQPGPVPKVAIPRLRRGSEDQTISRIATIGDKHRVTHACEPCRQRKTKCSGDRPICQHCQDFKLPCIYADGKRDRTRK